MNCYSDIDIMFEHHFWLQILGDHSRFILDALPSSEGSLIEKCKNFKSLFDKLLDSSRKDLDSDKINELTQLANKSAQDFRAFKLFILSKQLTNKIKFNLSPTFVNHMVNEIEEYIRILNCYTNKGSFVPTPIHYHLLWLSDGTGHADIISATLDMTEKEAIKLSKNYSKTFTDLYLKAIEFNGYTRTGLMDFPALNKLNEDANTEMEYFNKFLETLKFLVVEKRILGTISPLTPDHMFREECYYQTKLAAVSKIKKPECDPTKSRVVE